MRPLGPDTGTPDHVIRNRLRILTAADEAFGRVLDALDESGQSRDTVVVLTSDHGYFYGEHGLNEERRLAYEESIRVPLAIRWPAGIAPRTTSEAFALSVDLAPTVMELAGVPSPNRVDGTSLTPLFDGRVPAGWRDSVLIEYFSDRVWPRMVEMGYRAVRTQRWKYIRYTDLQGMDELYDLQDDPFETCNQWSSPGLASVRADLRKELERLLSETCAISADRS